MGIERIAKTLLSRNFGVTRKLSKVVTELESSSSSSLAKGVKRLAGKTSKKTTLATNPISPVVERVGLSKGKTKFQIQVEEEKQINEIIDRHLAKDKEYAAYIEQRKQRFLKFDPEATEEDLAKQMHEWRSRYLRRGAGDEMKLKPEEEQLMKSYIEKYKDYAYCYDSGIPAADCISLMQNMAEYRSHITSDVKYVIECNLGNNGMSRYEQEIIQKFKDNEFQVLTNEELREVHELLCGTNKSGDELLKLLRFDFTKIHERNIKELTSKFSGKRLKIDLITASDEEYALMSKRLQTRAQFLPTDNYDKLKSLISMSDKEFRAYQSVADKIPERFIITDMGKFTQMLSKDKDFVLKMAELRRSQEEIEKLMELSKQYPKLAKRLASKSSKNIWGNKEASFNIDFIEKFCKLVKEDKKTAKYFVDTFIKGKKYLDYTDEKLDNVLKIREKNPELFSRVISLKTRDYRGRVVSVFDDNQMLKFMEISQKDSQVGEFLLKNRKKLLKYSFDTDKILEGLSKNDGELIPYFKKYVIDAMKAKKIDQYEISCLIKAFDKDKSSTIKLLEMMESKDYTSISYYNFDQLVPLMQSDETIVRELLSMKTPHGNFRFIGSDIEHIFSKVKEDKNLFMSLAKEMDYAGNNTRYEGEEIAQIFDILQEDASFFLNLSAKTGLKKFRNKEVIEYVFKPETIKKVLKYRQDGNEQMYNLFNSLSSLTIKDSKGVSRMFLGEKEILSLMEKAKKEGMADYIAKYANEEGKSFLKFLSLNSELLKDKKFLESIEQYARKGMYSTQISKSVLTNENVAKFVYPNETIRVFINEADNAITAVESTKMSGSKLNITKTFTDGRKIVQEMDGVMKEGIYIPLSEKTVHYGANGQEIYRETISVAQKGDLYNASSHSVIGQRSTSSAASISTNFYGSNNQGMKTVREFTSPSGATTSYTIISGPKGHSMKYVIKNKNGQIISDIERRFRQLSENHFRSSVNGQQYDILHKGKEVIVSKLDSEGKPVETIILDSKVLSPKLQTLYKKLPGDVFFTIKRLKLKKIGISKREVDNAQYDVKTKKIHMGANLKDNPFVFTHELGHAIDNIGFKEYNSRLEWQSLYSSEVGDFQRISTTYEADIISYFTPKSAPVQTQKIAAAKPKIKMSSRPHGEGFAEGYAVSVGLPNEGYQNLGLRTVTLQRTIQESLARMYKDIYSAL